MSSCGSRGGEEENEGVSCFSNCFEKFQANYIFIKNLEDIKYFLVMLNAKSFNFDFKIFAFYLESLEFLPRYIHYSPPQKFKFGF